MSESGARVHEVADGIFRINTPVPLPDGTAFSFNQYLIVADEPLLFHTGPRKLFPVIRDAITRVLPPERLRWISFSHFEADECGSLNEWLAIAPAAQPACSRIAAMTSVDDVADRAPRALADGETLDLGSHAVEWIDAPHLPHGWETGYLFERRTRTLLCGDLFTQPGRGEVAVTTEDVLGPSEAFRRQLDYYAHGTETRALLERLATTGPTTLACMHGSAWSGDGAALLRALADSVGR